VVREPTAETGTKEAAKRPDTAERPDTAGVPAKTGTAGRTRVTLPASIVRAIVEHARAEYPNEACGIVSGTGIASDDGDPLEWYAARNEAASPLRFNVHPEDLYRIFRAIDDADHDVWAIVHSHVRSPARPSPTDVGMAASWPHVLWILVSLADEEADPVTDAPSVRAWRIEAGEVHEVDLEVTA
jgi:proteasome lid subunit RPN8/RPN11